MLPLSEDPEFDRQVAHIKAYLAASRDPYLFASPRDAGLYVLAQPLAEFRYALRDAVAIIPDSDEKLPSQWETLKSIVLDLAIDYPQYDAAALETLVFIGYARVLEHFQVTRVFSEPEFISEWIVGRGADAEGHETVEYELEYKLLANVSATMTFDTVRRAAGDLWQTMAILGEHSPERESLFWDLWSRLGSVPKSGSARTRSALLVMTSQFENYARETIQAAIAQRAVSISEEQSHQDFRDIARGKMGFHSYRKWIHQNLGEDLFYPIHEAFARRNVYVHNGGTATANYVSQFPSYASQAGHPLPLTRTYLLEVADTAAKVARTTTATLLQGVSRNKSAKVEQ